MASLNMPDEVEVKSMNLPSRFVGTLFWPGETFADVNLEPRWLAPIVVAMVVAFFSAVVWNQRIAVDWDQVIRDRYVSSGRAEPSAEMVQQQAGMAKKIFSYTPIINALLTPVIYLALAAAFAVGLTLMEAQTTYKKILAVVAWSGCCVDILPAIAMTTVLLLRPPSDVDPTMLNSVLATSLEFFLPASTGPALRALASSFDIFTIYFLILLVIGFARIGGSAKITKTATAFIVFGEWVLWIAVKVSWFALFGA
jgi:hypothetical protein